LIMQGRGVGDRPGPTVRGTDGDDGAPFGARLRRLREAAGLTQEEIASRVGLTAKAVSALERGERRRPYRHTVRSLADALSLTDAERASFAAAVPGRGESVRAPEAGRPPAIPPSPAPALVGRELDVEAVFGLIRHPENRLVMLTGPGGVGKTRLVTEVARTLLAAGSFPDGVVFVALAPLGDATLVLPTIAQALLDAGETEGLSSSAARE